MQTKYNTKHIQTTILGFSPIDLEMVLSPYRKLYIIIYMYLFPKLKRFYKLLLLTL